MKQATIQWLGPFNDIAQIRTFYQGPGIYCISGTCYREKKIKPQYIGISKKDVVKRLSDYWHTHKAVRQQGKCFYIGVIKGGKDLGNRLDLIENCLIYHFNPPLNRMLKGRSPIHKIAVRSVWYFKTTGNQRLTRPKEFVFDLSPLLVWNGQNIIKVL